MPCFTLGWVEQLMVQIVVIVAIIAILRLVVPWFASVIGIPILVQIVNIVLWAILAIIAIYFIFALLSCLLGFGGVHSGFFYQR